MVHTDEIRWLGTGFDYSGSSGNLMSEKTLREAEELGATKCTRNSHQRVRRILEGTPLQEDVTVVGTCRLTFYVEGKRYGASFEVVSGSFDLGFEMVFGKGIASGNASLRAKL